MPAYAGNDHATMLRNNQQAFLWQSENVTAGGAATPPAFTSLSLAYQLERINRSHYPWGLSFEVWFDAAPGAFEIDIMGANNDLYTNYVQIGTITAVNGFNTGRWDMPTNVWPKYIAAYMKTLANAVKVTLQVTH